MSLRYEDRIDFSFEIWNKGTRENTRRTDEATSANGIGGSELERNDARFVSSWFFLRRRR